MIGLLILGSITIIMGTVLYGYTYRPLISLDEFTDDELQRAKAMYIAWVRETSKDVPFGTRVKYITEVEYAVLCRMMDEELACAISRFTRYPLYLRRGQYPMMKFLKEIV